VRFAFLAFLLAFPALSAEHWTDYRAGPFHLFSDAGDRIARQRLNELEQMRYVLATLLDKKDFQTVWPIDILLFDSTKEWAAHALKQPFIDGGSATFSAWTGEKPFAEDWIRAMVKMLIDDNCVGMPEKTETAIEDLFSTIEVKGPKVSLGAPLPAGEITGDRLRNWAKLDMLAANPDDSVKLHLYLANLQQAGADENAAAHNAYDTTAAELNRRADDYLRAGNFQPGHFSGEALNPDKDFVEVRMESDAIDALLFELGNGGTKFPPDSPRGLVATGGRPALEKAAQLNPRWGEPHFRLAELETSGLARILELRKAAHLDPRNIEYWKTLAIAETEANLYADAQKSWAAAARAAPTAEERARVQQARQDLEEKRADFEQAEKKRIADEKARELQRIKDESAAEVHAAEDAANKRLGSPATPAKAAPWWSDPEGARISGSLIRVECLGTSIRITVQKTDKTTARLVVRDPKNLVVHPEQATFACGVQKPIRQIDAVYKSAPDAKLGTAGDVLMVEFH